MKQATNTTRREITSPPDIQPDDEDLIERIQRGDEYGFEILYNHYYPLVHKRIWHMIPENDVDDVTQNVFMAVIKSLPAFRGDAKFATWLYTITNRQIANYYRKSERNLNQTDQAIEEIQEILPDKSDRQNAQTIEGLVTLRRGIAQLPEDYQTIILMRLVEGFSFKDIANEFGKSLDAVKSLFRRAVAALQEKLDITYD